MARKGSIRYHDMWICITHATPIPMAANAAGSGTRPRRIGGRTSKKPMKNTTAPASTYEGFVMCVEKCSVHGAVMVQPQTSQRGTDGTRRVIYQESIASAPNDRRFNTTMGASGAGTR